MNTFLIRTLSDIEILIGDWKAGIIEEEDFKKQVISLANAILINEDAENKTRTHEDIVKQRIQKTKYEQSYTAEPFES